jgi:hypothetical protein
LDQTNLQQQQERALIKVMMTTMNEDDGDHDVERLMNDDE